jgi:hypothetical protein
MRQVSTSTFLALLISIGAFAAVVIVANVYPSQAASGSEQAISWSR